MTWWRASRASGRAIERFVRSKEAARAVEEQSKTAREVRGRAAVFSDDELDRMTRLEKGMLNSTQMRGCRSYLFRSSPWTSARLGSPVIDEAMCAAAPHLLSLVPRSHLSTPGPR